MDLPYKHKPNLYNPTQQPMGQHKILILEEEKARRDSLRSLVIEWGYLPFSFKSETICFDNLSSINPDLVVSGPLPVERAFRFLNTIKFMNAGLPVLMISEDEAIEDFITANDFSDVVIVTTDFESNEIRNIIVRILDKGFELNDYYNDDLMIVGISPEIVKIKKMIPELSRSKETVFIKGETGTGKDLLARVIHFMSDRRDMPFVKVNNSSLTVEFFEKELLGYSQEDFAGASKRKKGKVEAANGGAIFFDDVGKIPADLQSRLFQLIEDDGIFKHLPGSKEIIDIRIIASADADFDWLVESGKFRKDLFHRLNVFSIEIPPLRNRIEDIPLLIEFFADKFCSEFGKSYYKLPQKIKNIFCSYHWPGNVRELENMVKDVVLSADEGKIFDNYFIYNENNKFQNLMESCENIYPFSELKDLKFYVQDLENFSLKDVRREFLATVEKKLIKKALQSSSGNRKKASMMLEISYRSLLNKIKAYKLI